VRNPPNESDRPAPEAPGAPGLPAPDAPESREEPGAPGKPADFDREALARFKREKTLRIGSLELKNPFVLAPMAGLTNRPYRVLAAEFGAALVFSEMASAVALSRRGKGTLRLLENDKGEGSCPFGVQLFGKDPRTMAEAAKVAVFERGADLIDLNFACPARKVVRSGHGAALLKDPGLARSISGAVVKAVPVPVTVKTRPDFAPPPEGTDPLVLTLGKELEEEGIAAITLHPRHATQAFGGVADWSLVERLAASVGIPVIGSGDIDGPVTALKRLLNHGATFAMLGRATRGRPWLFGECLELYRGAERAGPASEPESGSRPTPGEKLPKTLALRLRTGVRHAELLRDYLGEKAVFPLRTILTWYTRDLPGAAAFRNRIVRESDIGRQLEILAEALSFERVAESLRERQCGNPENDPAG
jgi:tRNA-dihydrouridine synthase B